MSAPDDGQTYPAPASGRRRSSGGGDFDRRPGQARDFMSAGRNRTPGKLYPGRVRRGAIVARIASACPPSATAITLPNGVPADDCSYGATFKFAPIKGRIARDGLKLIDTDGPF